MVNTYISVPRDKGVLNCAAFAAGIVEAILEVLENLKKTEHFCGKNFFFFWKNYKKKSEFFFKS